MSISRAFVLLLVALSQLLISAAQSTNPADSAPPASSSPIDKATLRKRLISSMPPFLYERWKKYGQWDYKQQGSQYRDSTQFNFGAYLARATYDSQSGHLGLLLPVFLQPSNAATPGPMHSALILDCTRDAWAARAEKRAMNSSSFAN